MPVALHVLADDRSVQHIERGKEGRCTVAFVIVGHGRPAPLLQRQAGLGPVKRLYLRFFIHRQHNRMSGRRDVKADDIVQFLGEGPVVRQLELTPAVRRKTVCFPDRLHCRDREAGRFGHRSCRPMGRRMWWRIERQGYHVIDALAPHGQGARRTSLVPQQAIDVIRHEALLPSPDAGFGLAGRRHDRVGAEAIAAQQNDPGAPDMFLSRVAIANNRVQTISITG